MEPAGYAAGPLRSAAGLILRIVLHVCSLTDTSAGLKRMTFLPEKMRQAMGILNETRTVRGSNGWKW